MNVWIFFAIGAGVIFLLIYGYGLRLYLWGEGREKLEIGVRALLLLKGNGGLLRIERRTEGVVLVIWRNEGEMNSAQIRLRIPLSARSLQRHNELERALVCKGFEYTVIEGSSEWMAEVAIRVENIWAVGSAERGVEAANAALDALGFGEDSRFIYRLKGRRNWRMMRQLGTT